MAVVCGDGMRLKVADATPRLPGSYPPPQRALGRHDCC